MITAMNEFSGSPGTESSSF